MMIKKKLGVLAGAVLLASSAQAAFDEGNAVLFAYDVADDDTYFVDLGVTGQDIINGASVSLTDAGLATFLADNAGAQWTIIASVNDTATVAGPPAGASFANSGVVSTSASGSPVGSNGTTNNQQRLIMNDWLADVQAASAGASSFGVAGTDPASADSARNGGYINDSLVAVGGTSAIFYAQAGPNAGDSLSDPTVVTQIGLGGVPSTGSLSVGGQIEVTAVPVPAAAWLFGSALAGLTVIRRRK